jgi:hypothetical protein
MDSKPVWLASRTGDITVRYDAAVLRLVVQLQFRNKKGVSVHEETFNISIRKFLKIVGITSQREIEQAVRKALEEGHIKGDETFPASVTLAVPGLNISFKIDGEIRLQ